MIAPPRSVLAFVRVLLAMAFAGAWELISPRRCAQCGGRYDAALMRPDGRCAGCHLAGKDGAT